MSASTTQLSALALPAESAPPTNVATTSHSGGTPCWARNITGTVVSSSSSMMRGLVSATYDMTTSLNDGEVGTPGPWAEVTSTAVTCSSLNDASRLDVTA